MYVYHFMCESGHALCLSDLFFSNNLSKEKKRFSFVNGVKSSFDSTLLLVLLNQIIYDQIAPLAVV